MTRGDETDYSTGRDGANHNAMTTRLIVSMHDRRGNGCSSAAEPGADERRYGAVRATNPCHLRGSAIGKHDTKNRDARENGTLPGGDGA